MNLYDEISKILNGFDKRNKDLSSQILIRDHLILMLCNKIQPELSNNVIKNDKNAFNSNDYYCKLCNLQRNN